MSRQSLLDRLTYGRFSSSFLPALLVVALGVTGTVTYHAYKASREHREVVERVLAAYVSFVAEKMQESTQLGVVSCAEVWLYPVMLGKTGASMNQIRADGSCGARDGGRFDIDLTKGTAASRLPQPIVGWLLDTIPKHPAVDYLEHWRIGSLTYTVDGKPELISYALRVDRDRPVRAIGFIAERALPQIMATTREYVNLPDVMGTQGKLSDYFDFAYWTSSEPPAADNGSSFRQVRPLDANFGGIMLAVGLRQAGLLRLAPGGIPRSRGWEFLGLFALAVGLVACSLLLLRREEQLARTRANFVAGVSHELRTPLAQIRMFAEMLLLGRVRSDADRRRSLEIIDTEARRLSHLVENVLQAARSENGHLHVNPSTMRVAPIIRECVETFAVLAQARGMEFRMELQGDLVAPVDSAALRQIVLNLLDNAAKYGPDGQRVVVGVALFDTTARIWVDDEGEGIPKRERQRVFDPFYRARGAQHTTGSGIGLSVVRELAGLHGGNAWIEDAPDAGTRVVVEFPGAFLAAQAATGDFAVA